MSEVTLHNSRGQQNLQKAQNALRWRHWRLCIDVMTSGEQ